MEPPVLRVDGGTQSWREPWKPVAAAITDPRGRAREHLARCDALRKKVNLPRGHRAEVDRTRLRQLHCALLNVGLGVVGNAALWLLFFWGSVGLVGEGTDQVLARSLPGSPGSANGRSACRWMSACLSQQAPFPLRCITGPPGLCVIGLAVHCQLSKRSHSNWAAVSTFRRKTCYRSKRLRYHCFPLHPPDTSRWPRGRRRWPTSQGTGLGEDRRFPWC